MEVTSRVDMDAVERELKAAHYAIPNKLRSVIKASGQRVVEPEVRRRTPTVVRGNVVVRATTTAAYITTAGPMQRNQITGLLNFGGTLDTIIETKKKEALKTPWGPRRVVYRGAGGAGGGRYGKPGHVTGKHFLEAGRDASLPRMEQDLRDGVLEAFGSLPTTTT